MSLIWSDDEDLRLSCEDDEAAEYAATKLDECPYCGGRGNQEWMDNHEHGPSPFDDNDDIKAYWAGRSVLFI